MANNKDRLFLEEEIESMHCASSEIATLIKTMTKANGVIVIIEDAELNIKIGGNGISEEEAPDLLRYCEDILTCHRKKKVIV